jgi:hypothetical protein
MKAKSANHPGLPKRTVRLTGIPPRKDAKGGDTNTNGTNTQSNTLKKFGDTSGGIVGNIK